MQKILSWFGIHTTVKKTAPPKPTNAKVELKPAYHASPQLRLTELDPAFSKVKLRYGPGVYLYANSEHADRHARSINKGQIKKDRNPHPAVVYEAWVDVTNVFDTQKSYTRAELQFILDQMPQDNLSRLDLEKMSFPIQGEIFYNYLAGAFSDSADTSSLKSNEPQQKASEVMLKAGIRTLLGKIPDPDTGEWHDAYISLVPVPLQ